MCWNGWKVARTWPGSSSTATLPALVDLLPRQAKAQRRLANAIQDLLGGVRYEWVDISPRDLQIATEMDSAALSRALRELRQLKAFDYIPPFRGRAIRMLERDKPFGRLELDFKEYERRKAAEYEKLNRVIKFAESSRCREQEILSYFGETESEPCGRCDNCLRRGIKSSAGQTHPEISEIGPSATAPAVMSDRLLEAVRMALSGVARARSRFGKHLVAQMLCGSNNARIKRFGLQKLTTHGLLSDLKQDQVVELLDALLLVGCLEQVGHESRRPTVQLTERGQEVMAGRSGAELNLPLSPELARRFAGRSARSAAPRDSSGRYPSDGSPRTEPPAPSAPQGTAVEQTEASFSTAANDERQDVEHVASAESSSLPASTSRDLAGERPAASVSRGAEVAAGIEFAGGAAPSHYWTWRLLAAGFAADECAAIRGLECDTVLDHALRSVDSGWPVDPAWFLSPESLQAFAATIGEENPSRIRPLLSRLPPGTRYEEVQLFLKCRSATLTRSSLAVAADSHRNLRANELE